LKVLRADDPSTDEDSLVASTASGRSNEETSGYDSGSVSETRRRRAGSLKVEPIIKEGITDVLTTRLPNQHFTVCNTSMEVFLRLLWSLYPLAFVIIGWIYNGLCPANEFLPKLMVLTGILAIAAILFRIIKVHWFLPDDDTFRILFGSIPLSIDFVFVNAFYILYKWINRFKPSINQSSRYYCDADFYNIAWQLTEVSKWFVLAYVILKIGQGVLFMSKIFKSLWNTIFEDL
ncbi:hypothetical protein NPIL_578951, partial [Nephila pilipes]